MVSSNEVLWSIVRKECLLEEMRRPQAAEQMEEVAVEQEERRTTRERRRVNLKRLLTTEGI